MINEAIELKDYRLKAGEKMAKASIFSTFFPGKFSSPHIDPNFHLLRLKTIAPLVNTKHAIISIEARAGQGKSIVTAQFLQHIRADYAWLQLDLKDRDPVVIIAAILAALMTHFKKLNQSILYQMIINGEVSRSESDLLAPTLIKDLTLHLEKKFYLVFDDLHLLKDSEESLKVIKSLILNAPAHLHFIMISRSSLNLDHIFKNADAMHIDNASLALSQNDVALLFAKIFKNPLPADLIANLHQSTEGWIMGLILAGHALKNKPNAQQPACLKNLVAAQPKKFWNYFHNEILASLSGFQRRNLLCLALLENIPLDLARSLPLGSTIDEFLEYLVQKNFFIRRLKDAAPCYCFHHLFRNFLISLAGKELPDKMRRIILAKSARWHLDKKHYEQAVQYYLRAEAYGMVERIFQKVGLSLFGANRPAFNVETLKTIPPEIIRSKAWFSLAAAALYSNLDPPKSKVYLALAYQKFISRKDEIGEILILASLITYHVGVDCDFKAGKEFLPRAEFLYAKLGERLSGPAHLQIASAIVYGLCYFEGQTERAARYTEKIIQTARRHGLHGIMAMGVLARGLICNFDGDWLTYNQLVEASLFLLSSPRVSNVNKLSLLSLQMNLLLCQGDFVSCRYYRQYIEERIDSKLVAKTIYGPKLFSTDVSVAIWENRLEDAKRLVKKGLQTTGSNQSTHMQSIFWDRLAYIHALQGNSRKALDAMEKSSRLRDQVGGEYFIISSRINSGCIHALNGDYDAAEQLLSEAISEIESKIPASIISISAFACRAYARLKNGKTSDGLIDLKKFLRLLRHYRNPFYQYYNSTITKELLSVAMVHGIEPETVTHLGKNFLRTIISPTGAHIPLLEINTLGNLEIKIDGTVRVTFADLTKTQKELLALLIGASPDKGVPNAVIQEAFWPDGPSDKKRSNMDNLFARLKKAFNTLLEPYSAGDYLCSENGFMHIRNCVIDAGIFESDFRQGIRHMRTKEFWQAGNAFLRAHFRYKGEFLPGVYLHDPVAYLREDLRNCFTDGSLHWARLLFGEGRLFEAIQVCQKAILHDPINEPLVTLLFNLFNESNDVVQAKKVLSNYRNALRNDGFSSSEIREIIMAIEEKN